MDLIELDDFHWLMDILQTIDVGLVVIDRQYQVQLWNGFMENHSGQLATHIRGQNLLTQFPDLPVSWLQRKVEEVFALHSPVFSSWEQRPRLFDFSSTRPFTGNSTLMYQNITLMPLVSFLLQLQLLLKLLQLSFLLLSSLALSLHLSEM